LAAGLRPNPLGGGAYSAPPDSLAGFRGGRDVKERRVGMGGDGRDGEGRRGG